MKTLRTCLFTLICLLLLFFVFLPRLASTPWGKKIFVKLAFGDYSKNTSLGSLDLTWLGPQKIGNLNIKTKAVAIDLEQLHADISFFSFFTPGNFSPAIFEKVKKEIELVNGKVTFPLYDAEFHSIHGKLDHCHNKTFLCFSIKGASEEKGNKGSFEIKGNIDRLSKKCNELVCHGNINLDNIPTIAIDSILSFYFPKPDRIFQQILGSLMTLHCSASIDKESGRINGDFLSTRMKTYLDMTFSQGIITLNKDLITSIRLTPALSNYLLRDINPLFITGIEAENLIHLKVYSRQFSLPVLPLHISNMKLKASLDMGKIRCKNGGILSLLTGLMKYHTLFGVNEMNVWFTPVNIDIENGIATTDRMDALVADTLQVCTWGEIDLQNDKIKMLLGLTGQALEQAFPVRNLPRNYVMQIPLRGTTKDPKIDMGKAAALIATLIATTDATDKRRGFLGKIVTKSVTPPAKLPFPWENKAEPAPRRSVEN